MAKKKTKKRKNSNLFDDLKGEIPKSKSVGYNALKSLQLNSENVLGDFSKELLDSAKTVTDKLALIQGLENIALAETIKSFDPKTRDLDKLGASNRLLSITRSLKTTIKEKHSLETQEVIDFTHPKYSKSFHFLLEVFVKVLTDTGLEGGTILRVVDTLTVSTEGFEERLNHLFTGVPINELEELTNPFIQDKKVESLDYVEIEDAVLLEEPKKKKKKKKKKHVKKP